jgi:hypothetical protein
MTTTTTMTGWVRLGRESRYDAAGRRTLWDEGRAVQTTPVAAAARRLRAVREVARG